MPAESAPRVLLNPKAICSAFYPVENCHKGRLACALTCTLEGRYRKALTRFGVHGWVVHPSPLVFC